MCVSSPWNLSVFFNVGTVNISHYIFHWLHYCYNNINYLMSSSASTSPLRTRFLLCSVRDEKLFGLTELIVLSAYKWWVSVCTDLAPPTNKTISKQAHHLKRRKSKTLPNEDGGISKTTPLSEWIKVQKFYVEDSWCDSNKNRYKMWIQNNAKFAKETIWINAEIMYMEDMRWCFWVREWKLEDQWF